VFATVLCVLALLVVGGVRMIARPALGGSALASVGAIAAGFTLFWTIAAISISIAIAIAILSVLVARRGSARPSVQPA